MDNNETTKKIIGLPSTIVAGIFLSFAVLFAAILLTMNLKVAVEQYMASLQESANENSENAGEVVIVLTLVAGFGLLAIYILYYAMVFIPFIVASICFIPAMKNVRRADNKAIKIINFVYLGLIATVVTICIIKFILFVTGVA